MKQPTSGEGGCPRLSIPAQHIPASGQPGRAQAVGLDGLCRLFWSTGMSINASHLNFPIIEPPHPKNHKPKLVAATH